jgi:hypothetical protein
LKPVKIGGKIVKKVLKQIQPLNEEELVADLKFLLNTHWDTNDQLIEQLVPLVKYHVTQVMSDYNQEIITNISRHLQSEVVGVVVRSKREAVYEDKPEVEEVESAW